MNIDLDKTSLILENLKLKDEINELKYQARKSICQSCVSMTNQAHNQDCIIEEQDEKIKTLLMKVDYLQRSLDSAKGDTKALQKFLKGVGQASYYEMIKREAI